MTEQEFFDALNKTQSLQQGHFIFASGRHAVEKIDFDFLVPYPHYLSLIVEALAEHSKAYDFNYLLGPGVNGAVLASGVSLALSRSGRSVPWGYAEKNGRGGFETCAPHSEHLNGKRVYMVDDVLTRATTFKKCKTLIEALGGTLVGATAVCSRKQVATDPELPRFSWLFAREMSDFAPEECPICHQQKNKSSLS